MNKWKSGLEVAVNVAILSVCVLVGVVAVKKFLLPTPDSSASTPKKGTHLDLPGVDWSRSDRTLVMALSTECHFCTESAPFYQRLLPAASASKVPVVVVFPQAQEEARDYLTSHNLPLGDVAVEQATLGRIQISGTPTLMVVDRKGVILRAWAGKLPAQGEAEVINAIQAQGAS